MYTDIQRGDLFPLFVETSPFAGYRPGNQEDTANYPGYDIDGFSGVWTRFPPPQPTNLFIC
jgi:hypothetical protein